MSRYAVPNSKFPNRSTVCFDDELLARVMEFTEEKQQSFGATIRQACVYYLESVQS